LAQKTSTRARIIAKESIAAHVAFMAGGGLRC
jgi:hypothetical protein